jgi:predicted RNA-binding Zn-ribbon protein involved in translation (DUF1610 family)
VATSRKADTCVNCPTCSSEIPLPIVRRLPEKFSVLCPRCGGRKIYLAAEVRDLKQEPEAAQTSRKMQFGRRGCLSNLNPG